jgi:hypothetical protein
MVGIFNVVLALPKDLEDYVHLENLFLHRDIFSVGLHYQNENHYEMISWLC